MKIHLPILLLISGSLLITPKIKAQQVPIVPSQATDIAPLLYGEQAPAGLLMSISGDSVSLTSILAEKPTVLIFYRGGWCPYCNTQLQEMQAGEKEIIELGYQIVAISPDSPEKLANSIEKNNLNYQIYSDATMQLAHQFGIAFMASERQKERLQNYSRGQNPGWLPVPSVFVLDQEGKILFEFINPNYKVRLSGKLLLNVLKAL